MLTGDSEIRYILMRILVEIKSDINELLLVATDGRKIGMFCNELGDIKCQGEPGEITLPKPDFVALRASTLKSIDVDYSDDGTEAAIVYTCGKYSQREKIIEGAYPKFRQIIPEKLVNINTDHLCLNPNYLLEIVEAGRLICGINRDSTPLKIAATCEGNLGSVVVGIGNDRTFFAILMPMRSDHSIELPEWAKKVPPKSAAPVETKPEIPQPNTEAK